MATLAISGEFNLLREESGAVEAHARGHALVSSEARHPGRFTLRTAREIRTRTTEGLDLVPPAKLG